MSLIVTLSKIESMFWGWRLIILVPAEDPGSIPSTHVVTHTVTNFKGSSALFRPLREPDTFSAQISMCRQNNHTEIKLSRKV